ncbi:MAG TPA: MFS transporter, partial [Micromonosporaceae bacterium]|nr:MFS transporter [Micromonosporaceae bacterium]
MVEIDSATTPTPSTLRGWAAVAALAAGTFSVVTTEMLPVGLLTPIRAELQVSDGIAGLTMTVPGLAAAAAAPLLIAGMGRLDRRAVLVALMTLLAVANLASAVAPNIGVMVAARLLVGICIGGVWAIAAGLAARLVPRRAVGSATSVVFSGIAVASVLGVPAGTFVGEWGGWRAAFTAMALAALVVAGALALLLPPLPAEQAAPFNTTLRVVRDVRVRVGLLVVLLLVTGHFAAYTYVRPALEQLSGVDVRLVSSLLLLYGLAGVVGNFVAGAGAARNPRR